MHLGQFKIEEVCFVQFSVATSQCQATLYVARVHFQLSYVPHDEPAGDALAGLAAAPVISITSLGCSELHVWTCCHLSLSLGHFAMQAELESGWLKPAFSGRISHMS